jgi:iron complex outermembrane recepter protein
MDERTGHLILLAGVLALVPLPALAGQSSYASTESLKHLSIEELLNVEVTSVSKSAEPVGEAAAAVTVVSAEDIRRSGATSVPEALRSVPGIYVARKTASTWAVSARGFSSANSEKLLVLSDTRSIYTPLFSGVFWDVQDYLMDDIERIEVIRGPGAALWGSNAVNGVINITTRSARETQGAYFEAASGTEEKATVAARYGGRIGDAYYRVSGKYLDRDDSFHLDPATSDDWRLAHLSFRADWDRDDFDRLTLQSDVYSGHIGQLSPSITIIGRPGVTGDLQADVAGGNILGRWRHTLSTDSDLQIRAYFDRTHRNDPTYVDDLDTWDFDLQHRFAIGETQRIVWGLNYRLMADRMNGKGTFVGILQPRTSHDALISGFVQDQIALAERLQLTLGTKLEQNDFSGFEVQPSVRAAWEPSSGHTLWAAVSRAVRVPTRLERDISVDASDPAGNPVLRLLGNEDFDAEELRAYELGYRWQVLPNVSVDLAGFHNRYRDLASLELGTPFVETASGKIIIPITNENRTDGRADGVELQTVLSPTSRWRLTGTYSYVSLHLQPRGLDLNRGKLLERATPRHQLGLRSSIDLPAGFEMDAQLRGVTAVESSPQIPAGERIPGYAELDVRLAWNDGDRIELSLVGQNLLHDHHAELATASFGGEVERAVYARVVYQP